MPVTIHERVPMVTQEQATWYWQAAREVSEMTQSPCNDGVLVDWQEVISIDAVRLKQNFKKSSKGRAKNLALEFVEEDGTCTHCEGEGEDEVCTTYPIYRLKTQNEVMANLDMNNSQQKDVKEKYLVVNYDFLIGYKSVAGNYNQLYSGEFFWPVPSCHNISSPYGMRIHPTLGTQRMHYGIDIPASEEAEIVAPADGKIKSYTPSDAVGWTMVVDHGTNEQGQRIETRYCHLLDMTVNVGHIVAEGDSIALVGNTGYLTTGPHLHFEVHIDGVTVDPAGFFKTR